MRYKYRADTGLKTKSKGKIFVVIFISLLIFAALGAVIYWDLRRSESEVVSGVSVSVPQEEDLLDVQRKKIDEPYFSFELPPDWKEVNRHSSEHENFIEWQASKKNADNRWLKLYVDLIPPDIAVNRLLPIDVSENRLSYRQISDNCKNFTRAEEDSNVPKPSRWHEVDFICDLPAYVQNKVGTGTEGSLNSIKITGPKKGTHRYFFLYTDHNIQPDYSILYDVIESFEAK